jgi:hypothetical protein
MFFILFGKGHVKSEVSLLINDYLLLCKDAKKAMMGQYAVCNVSMVIDTEDIFLRRNVFKSEDSTAHIFRHSGFEELVHDSSNEKFNFIKTKIWIVSIFLQTLSPNVQ